MKREFVKLAQRLIHVPDDGVFGPVSRRAARTWVGDHPAARPAIPADRWVALIVQIAANRSGEVPHQVQEDAWWGPVTQDAAFRLMGQMFSRPDEDRPSSAVPHGGAVRCWTPSDKVMMQHFGQVGTRQVVATLPFPMRLDWDLPTVVTRASMHTLAAQPITAALEEIRDHYGLDQIPRLGIDRFGGILNVRRKRGGSTWSAHAWGTAIDLWPDANQLAWKRGRAVFARPEYAAMIDAFHSAGMMSLGTCYDFDWMHFQLNPTPL